MTKAGTDSSSTGPEGELRVFLVAGEPSGDALAGPLMAALRRRLGPGLRFAGVGGERMAEQGLSSQFPMSDLSLVGLVEVIPRIPRLLRRLNEVEAAIRRWQPHTVVTVDAPGFNFRLAARLRGSGIPIVHYVAPSVWAWRPDRAQRLAPLLRHLLVLLPFEPPWFDRWGLPTTYVGHPALESVGAGATNVDRPLPPRSVGPLLCLLPGSRSSELRRLLPVFAETVDRLRERHPRLTTVLPTVPAVVAQLRDMVRSWPQPPEIILDRSAALAAMECADVALAASGTVTLELALLGTPYVACYRTNPLTGAIVRRMLRVPHVTLANLVLGRTVVPELLQERCRPDLIVAELDKLLTLPEAVAAQKAAFEEVRRRLAVDMSPSEKAASIVAQIVQESATEGYGRS